MSVLKGQVFATADLPTKTTGDVVAISLDETGSVRVTGAVDNPAFPDSIGQKVMAESLSVTMASNQAFAPNVDVSAFTDGYSNVQTGICNFVGVYATNNTAGVLYLQIHDRATTPANGTVPKLAIRFAANESKEFFLPYPMVISMLLGLTVASSSTAGTLTLGSAGDFFVTTFYSA